jgi:hypothetical protein
VLLNPLNPELNPIFHLLALFGVHHILHVSRIRVKDYQPRSNIVKNEKGDFDTATVFLLGGGTISLIY